MGLFSKADLQSRPEMPKEVKKSIHKLIKKVTQDIENFSFNTTVAAFMIALNELTTAKSTSAEAMEIFTTLIAPFAPHLAEEFWHQLGHEGSVADAAWPAWDEAAIKDDTVKYPVSFNGKSRFVIEVPADTDRKEVERLALENPAAAKWLEGKSVKKVIVVPGKIVNVVVG